MDDLIRVVQLPVIEEQLRTLKESVDHTVADALAMVCTEETVQSVKATRTDLNKRFEAMEYQRKAVKTAVLAPYERFEAVYKECVSDAFKRADSELKRKIDDTEREIKRRCEEGLREYFSELCEAHHLDFLTFERSGVVVDMASAKQKTPKKLREQLAQFVARVSQDVDLVAAMDGADEIMVEYKRSLSVAEAIGTVQERHRRLDAEREAAATREAARAREAEAVRRVEAFAPPAALEPEPVLCVAFKAYGTRAQFIKLKKFMDTEGIRYE